MKGERKGEFKSREREKALPYLKRTKNSYTFSNERAFTLGVKSRKKKIERKFLTQKN